MTIVMPTQHRLLGARGSQCNLVSSTGSIQSTDKWHTTNQMVIRTSQGLQMVDRAESTSHSECGDMEMMVKGLIPIPYWRQSEQKKRDGKNSASDGPIGILCCSI